MSARVLVIEDDPDSLELMFYLLSAHGYVTTTAARGDDGLAAVRNHRPDLVVCDIQLPGLDGYAIAGEMKRDASLRNVPLVAVTALAMVGDRKRVLAAGFDAYVSKPIDPSAFIAQIEPYLKPAVQSASRATIVVVDDTPVNQELACSILEPSGYRVLTATSVGAGMNLIRTQQPALIISDVGLPDATGLDLLRLLKADPQLQHIPVLMVTATHRDWATEEAAMRLGASRFLLRPLDAVDVLREVETCLAGQTDGARCGEDSGR